MDVHCTNCREPWEFLYLMDEVKRAPAGSPDAEGFVFDPPSSVNVVECPACPRDDHGKVIRRALTQDGVLRAVLAGLLGDDVDGFAAECEDLGI
jgi:hypothetical protein